MTAGHMHPTLKAQLRDATRGRGDDARLDIGELLDIVSRHYQRQDALFGDTSHHTTTIVNGALQDTLATTQTSTSGIRARFSGLLDDDLRAVLDNIADMVLTVDASGLVNFSNRWAVQFFEPEVPTLAGSYLSELLGLPESTNIQAWLQGFIVDLAATAPDLCGQPLSGHKPDGSTFNLEVSVSELSAEAAGEYVVCMRDVSARASAAAALAENEERYRALVEFAPDAILVFDADAQCFVDANENACQLFNLSRKRLLSSGFLGVHHDMNSSDVFVDQKRINAFVSRALAGEQPVFEWTHANGRDTEVPCEVRLSRLPAADRQLVRVSVQSIESRKKRELADYSERKLLEMIASGASLKTVMRALCRTAERLVGGSRVAIMVLDGDEANLELQAAPAFQRRDLKGLRSIPLQSPVLSSGLAMATNKTVITTDVLAHNAWAEHRNLARRLSIASAWSVPMLRDQASPLGTIDLYFQDKREPNTEELDALGNLAGMAGIALYRDQSNRALLQSESRFRGLFENVAEGVYISDMRGQLLSANPALVRTLGFVDEADLIRSVSRENTYQSSKDRESFLRQIEEHGEVRGFEAVMVRRDGTPVDIVENARAVTYPDGRRCIEGTITDITERKRAERRIFAEKERAEVTLKSIGDGVITTDADGCVEYLNPVAEELTGFSLRALSGEPVGELVTLVHEHSREMLDNPILQALQEGRVVNSSTPVMLIDRSGGEMPVQISAAPIREGSGHIIGAVMVFHDVSNADRLSRKLSYQATHDALTGFVNRHEFDSVLGRAITQRRQHDGGALLYIDLDQFKVVNDTFGHTAGDELIRQIAQSLQTCVPPTDVIARLGGDEFAVLLGHADEQEALRIAESIRATIEQHRFEWQGAAHSLSASIGAVMLESEQSVGSVMSAADVACFAAKDLGRNKVHVYRHGEASARHQEMHWLTRINRALEEDRFELFYQPIVGTVATAQSHCSHYELLLRMRDDEGGYVLPATFISAAERYDKMPAVDRWVVTEALKHADRGSSEREASYTLSINLSGNSLSDDRFLEFVKDALNDNQLCRGAVCFEITETAAISDLSRVTHFMTELKALGCKFSLDDFGSGLSSFAYLKNLPVDYIKIDGAFIRNITTDTVDQSMVSAILKVSEAMGIQTIAEHVENGATRATLAGLGIPLVQGFEVAKPAPVSSFVPWTASEQLA
ncbi:MAG: EAL domain-containing protein [Pseudomonadota bacterium]